MNKIFLFSMMIASATTAVAQNSYDAYNIASSDLNGTARYVGMGGALSALGGDVSVMGTNPAGTAMYRKSEAAFTLSGVFADDGVLGHDGTRASIDNAGVVVALPVDEGTLNYVNFGFNYHKNKNFLQNISTGIDHLDGIFSQTFQIANLASQCYNNSLYIYTDPKTGVESEEIDWDKWSSLAYQSVTLSNSNDSYANSLIDVNENYDGENDLRAYLGIPAQSAAYQRAQWGHNSQMDANLSFNVLDKYFFGLTLGVYSLDSHRESLYGETAFDGSAYDIYNYYDQRGDGVDLKFGFICRPIDDSNFRFGVSVHTPTWYRLEDVCGSEICLASKNGLDYTSSLYLDPWEYNYRTPWKFALSLGHTIGDYFAIGAEYEYTDMSTAHYSQHDDYLGAYYREQNEYIKHNLKGQSTLKLGMEVKPAPSFSIRAGYNYISSPFESDAYNTINYLDNFTETDFTNWKDTHRFTVGLGYRYNGGYIDLAYQYQSQKGDFYAFDDVDLKSTEINNDRSQLLCTFGFRF